MNHSLLSLLSLSFAGGSTPPRASGNEITVNLPGDVSLTLVRIPAGSLQMGSPDSERSRVEDEGPAHRVDIASDFYMGKYTVTQGQYLAVMGRWPENAPEEAFGSGDDYPAYWLSWNDCQEFITALNAHIAKTGQGPAAFRLPSESEWEYACRAGTQTRFYFGDSLSVDDAATDGPAGVLPGNRSDYMWFSFNCHGDSNGAAGSKPVGTKRPNQFGLYDMSGNMWEWVQDWRHLNYIDAPTDGSAWEDVPARYRMCRGGDWHYNADSGRSANRGYANPNSRYHYVGLRLANASSSSTIS